jgi:hypothetical protein
VFFSKNKKNKKTSNSSENQQWNDDFKRNKSVKKNVEQQNLYSEKKLYSTKVKSVSRTKKGLSCDYKKISSDQVKILKKCQPESTSLALMKISGRKNKTKFMQDILNPLIKCGFFELTIPERPRSPKQKYRSTGFFVKRKIDKKT